MLAKDSRWLILLLSAFVALGPLSTDMYLPALPAMVERFSSSVSEVQLTISSYLVGFALFHLVCGPLADRYGRKPVLLGGLMIFCLASIGCALARDIETLIAFRFLQGVGACTGPTLGRAMVRDIHGAAAARPLALMAAIMALAPVIAPTLGGWMLLVLPWSSIFWFLLVYGLIGIVALWLWLPESLPVRQPLRARVILRNFSRLSSSGMFMGHVVAASLLYAGAFAFISGSSFVLIGLFDVPAHQFGYWFMFIVAGYIAGNLFTIRVSVRLGAGWLMLAGSGLGLLAGLSMLLLVQWWPHPLSVIGPMALYTAAVGIAMPHAMAAALAPFPDMAGTASALMGFVQMGFAAVAGVVVGLLLAETALPMTATISAVSAGSLLLFALLQWRQDGHRRGEV